MLCHPAISAVLVQQQAKHFMTRHCHPVRYVMRTKNRLERVLSGGGGGACRRQLVDWRHILCPPCGRLEMCSSVFCEMRLFSILKRAVDVRNNGRRVWSERGGEGATPGIVGREGATNVYHARSKAALALRNFHAFLCRYFIRIRHCDC